MNARVVSSLFWPRLRISRLLESDHPLRSLSNLVSFVKRGSRTIPGLDARFGKMIRDNFLAFFVCTRRFEFVSDRDKIFLRAVSRLSVSRFILFDEFVFFLVFVCNRPFPLLHYFITLFNFTFLFFFPRVYYRFRRIGTNFSFRNRNFETEENIFKQNLMFRGRKKMSSSARLGNNF